MSESKAEEAYRKGMVTEAMNMVRSRVPLFIDSEIGTLLSYLEVELRERDTAREEARVAAYSQELPF